MKIIVLFCMILATLPTHARGKMRAYNTIDNGKTITVVEPHIRGCANGMCYGGPGDYMLRPFFSGRKICKELGLGNYIRGSKEVEIQETSMLYEPFGYYILERSGPPGAPMPMPTKIIVSVDREKASK